MNTPQAHRLTQSATALGLSLLVTLATLGGLSQLAGEQHAATLLTKAAAQQADQARVALPVATRG